MGKSMVTDYHEVCIFCGKKAEAQHHLIFGMATGNCVTRMG